MTICCVAWDRSVSVAALTSTEYARWANPYMTAPWIQTLLHKKVLKVHLAWSQTSEGHGTGSFLLGKLVTKAVPTWVPPMAVMACERCGAWAPWCKIRLLLANLSSDLNFRLPMAVKWVSHMPHITLDSDGNCEKLVALRINPVGLMAPRVRPGCCTGPGFWASPILIRVWVKRMARMASTETSTCMIWHLRYCHSFVFGRLLANNASILCICSSRGGCALCFLADLSGP